MDINAKTETAVFEFQQSYTSSVPGYLQLACMLERAIDSGRFDTLLVSPSVEFISKTCRVSREIVILAFSHLSERGKLPMSKSAGRG